MSSLHKVFMKKVVITTAALVLLTLGMGAPLTSAGDTLNGLLEEVAAVGSNEQHMFRQRAAAFNAAQASEQERMLQEAQANRDALAANSNQLSAQFSANELKLNEFNKQLQEKAAKLGLAEVFGLARQVAGDAATVLQQSLISTQFPTAVGEQDRDDFLRNFASSRTTPTSIELERVWFELQREMTASGDVAKYYAKIVQPSGEAVDAEVVRVGPFTAVADGKFLSYSPTLQSLSVFPRQPPEEFLRLAQQLGVANNGYVQAVVDSTRGVLMSLYVERPTWWQRIELGEEIGFIILIVGAVASAAFLFQLVYLVSTRLSVSRQLHNLDKLSDDNPLGRVLLAFKGDPKLIEDHADVAELRISEAVLGEVPKLERFQGLLRLSVAAGPLLGLIGTVVGMIITFQSITESGSSDPKLMATGIGQAMIATVLGLGIAIPLLFANALLTALSRGVTQIIEQQAAGILAESIERKRYG